MSDAIKAALDAAAKRLCICDGECYETRHGMMNGPCEGRPRDASAAIAAFLRALPAYWPVSGDPVWYFPEHLAADMERAAGGGDE